MCKHHWSIERTDSPVAKGQCTLCQETREFANTLDTAAWQRSNVKKDVAPIGSEHPEYWHRIAEGFAVNL